MTYRGSASGHGRCSAEGDHAGANAHAEVLAGVYRELRSRGAESQRDILQLLDDDDESVRSWAGAHTLGVGQSGFGIPYMTDPPIAVLTEQGFPKAVG